MSKLLLHERLNFDTQHGQVLDQDRRYVLLRADVLMGLFDQLPEDAKSLALDAFYRSVFTHGGRSVAAYDVADGKNVPQLFETVGAGAASLGWGVWEFEHYKRSSVLRVLNSPFAHSARASSSAVCAPIRGMFQALCSRAWNQSCAVVELKCFACDPNRSTSESGSVCIFEASPAY